MFKFGKTPQEYFDLGKKSYDSDNLSKAVDYYKKAAEAGHADAAGELSKIFLETNYFETNYLEESLRWAELSAQLGNTNALFELAISYYDGEWLVKENKQYGIELMEEAANYGNSTAMYNLGIIYWNGDGVPKNKEKSVQWFEKSAMKGNTNAFNIIKSVYSEIDPENCDYRYFSIFKNIADAGYYEGMLRTYENYCNGTGTEVNIDEGMKYLERAVIDEYPRACHEMANCYFYSKHGISQKKLKACILWEKAAKKDHMNSAFNLGVCYRDGEGVEKNIEKSIFWFERARSLGSVAATIQIGKAYDEEGFANIDYKKAFSYYSEAYKSGNLYAAVLLGDMYHYGRGVVCDNKKAKELYQEAVEHGDAAIRGFALSAFCLCGEL